MAVLESISLVWVVLFTAVAPRWARPLYLRMLRVLGRIASRPGWTTLCLGVGTTALVAALAHVIHWPEPSVHDEFAYLLGAETFAGGELTRPSHPHWEHFETFHVLMEPSYAPKYPPGQSLLLALGMVLTGEIRAGIWLGAGAMVAAMFWMMTQWIPRRWALFGALLLAMHLGIRGPWVQTFYGGALAATGGALMLGAIPGILRRQSTGAALVLAAGLVLLGMTRPFEGLVCSLPAAVLLLVAWIRSAKGQKGRFALRVALPVLAILGAFVSWVGLHNAAVTGSPSTLPYAAYDAQYSVYPPFLFQPVAPIPIYRHGLFEEFMLHFQRGAHSAAKTPGAEPLATVLPMRQWGLLRGLLGPVLALLAVLFTLATCVPGLRRAFPSGGGRALTLPLAIVLALSLAACFTTYAAPHYAAPGLGALMVVFMAGWRRVLARSRMVRKYGAATAVATLLAVGAMTAERATKRWLGGERYLGQVRGRINAGLLAKPGADLVLVRRGDGSSIHNEFVYNAADIDGAEVVWARDLGDERNTGLLEHFKGRNVWRLTLEHLREGRWTLERVGADPAAPGPASNPSPPRWGTW